MAAYNVVRRLKTLIAPTPYEYIAWSGAVHRQSGPPDAETKHPEGIKYNEFALFEALAPSRLRWFLWVAAKLP